jgi:hypothetical protein
MAPPAWRRVRHRCHPSHQQPNQRRPGQQRPRHRQRHPPKPRQGQTSRRHRQAGIRRRIRPPGRYRFRRRQPQGQPVPNRPGTSELMSRPNGLPTSSTAKSSPRTAPFGDPQRPAGGRHLTVDLQAASGPPGRRPATALETLRFKPLTHARRARRAPLAVERTSRGERV